MGTCKVTSLLAEGAEACLAVVSFCFSVSLTFSASLSVSIALSTSVEETFLLSESHSFAFAFKFKLQFCDEFKVTESSGSFLTITPLRFSGFLFAIELCGFVLGCSTTSQSSSSLISNTSSLNGFRSSLIVLLQHGLSSFEFVFLLFSLLLVSQSCSLLLAVFSSTGEDGGVGDAITSGTAVGLLTFPGRIFLKGAYFSSKIGNCNTSSGASSILVVKPIPIRSLL